MAFFITNASRTPDGGWAFENKIVHMEFLDHANGHLKGTGRLTNEALRLLGGRVTPKARWVWAAPKMSIGSTVVGPVAAS